MRRRICEQLFILRKAFLLQGILEIAVERLLGQRRGERLIIRNRIFRVPGVEQIARDDKKSENDTCDVLYATTQRVPPMHG